MKRKIKKQITTVTIATLLVASVLLVSTASATVTPTGWKEGKEVAGTTLDFTSSFLVTDGELDPSITITIDNVGGQSITVTDVDLKKCTPKPKNCNNEVTVSPISPLSIAPGGTGVFTVTVDASAASFDVKNVHLWVMLDGGYHIGVNVHFR